MPRTQGGFGCGRVALLLWCLVGCAGNAAPGADHAWDLPPGFPTPWVPADNPMNTHKVELGRRLFYDKRLSVTGTMSCASCHQQERAFTDGLATPKGALGHAVARNSMTLTNVAYAYPLTWQNPVLETLEEQALVPLFADAPVELGIADVVDRLLVSFQGDGIYGPLFRRAFAGVDEPFTPNAIVSALAAFERTLISGRSPYDRFQYDGDEQAFSASAKAGLRMFLSERLECYHCHTGLTFTSGFRSAAIKTLSKDYQNDGLYNLPPDGAYPSPNVGLSGMSGQVADNGKFRVPTLRNIAVTAPYMHDGSVATLDEVIDQYAAGGRNVVDGPSIGDGRTNPHKSPLVHGFSLTPDEKTALRDFLESLTDLAFLTDPRFSDPWLATP